MNFTSTIFNLAESVLQAFVDLGKFFTNGRFVDRILETLDAGAIEGSMVDIFADVISWLLNQFNPYLLECSFAELLLVAGIPLILVLSFVTWLWRILPIA